LPSQRPLILPHGSSSGKGFSCLLHQTTPSTLAALCPPDPHASLF
jgi:hypothetical protein